MALGNNGMTNFKPKASKTAERLLRVVTFHEQKKEVTIQLRISDDKRQMFKEICKAVGAEMSDVLRAYIDSVITEGTI